MKCWVSFAWEDVEVLINEFHVAVSSDIDLKATLDQMDKQKKMIAKFETERLQYKTRIKELSDEMAMMQGRELQGSDEDSPDQLSEIDRQQELMANISMKNKHIKRLLRDIEVTKISQGNTQKVLSCETISETGRTIIILSSCHQRTEDKR